MPPSPVVTFNVNIWWNLVWLKVTVGLLPVTLAARCPISVHLTWHIRHTPSDASAWGATPTSCHRRARTPLRCAPGPRWQREAWPRQPLSELRCTSAGAPYFINTTSSLCPRDNPISPSPRSPPCGHQVALSSPDHLPHPLAFSLPVRRLPLPLLHSPFCHFRILFVSHMPALPARPPVADTADRADCGRPCVLLANRTR